MAMDEIHAELGGKWKLDRSENFDEVLKELGLNILFRKMASVAKPVIEFTVEENIVNLISKVSFFNQVMEFKLNEEYTQSFEGIDMICFSRWEDKKLITEAKPAVEGKGKPQRFQRERINDEIIQTMTVGDVVCTRVFTKMN
ncbi:cellular retinoic acid-binding protein 2-like isoform X2 [Mizuhopecten yessoensis]|uniref:cellular retinoic acid-binding protein 2-like isoform X2 n=1 Tax=Mizuhopecten yessoensis TaxID=6573 RepID=UPI000B45D667|nr:cellular retinoic acid-binding protein 2-like isoform X2 [Mizuhopecten yessoensis]